MVRYEATRNEPLTISVTRTRGPHADTLELVERGNDLDRDGGRAFVRDLVSPGTVGDSGGVPTLEDAEYDPGPGIVEMTFSAPVSIDKEGLWISREGEDRVVRLDHVEMIQFPDREIAILEFGDLLPPGGYTLQIRSAAIRHAHTGGSLDGNGDGRPWGDYELEFVVE